MIDHSATGPMNETRVKAARRRGVSPPRSRSQGRRGTRGGATTVVFVSPRALLLGSGGRVRGVAERLFGQGRIQVALDLLRILVHLVRDVEGVGYLAAAIDRLQGVVLLEGRQRLRRAEEARAGQ